MSFTSHALFVAAVALASYVQNLTGFAFGLILLGLVGLLHLAPLADVTNVVSILTLVNLVVLLRAGLPPVDWRSFLPTLAASLVGVGLGVALLNWMSDNVVQGLRALLGATIVLAAALLVAQPRTREQLSGRGAFAFTGLLSGVMGGVFSTAGPPLVFHYYRQPMPLAQVRAALILVFAANAVLRLGLLGASGRVNVHTLWMSLEAAPVVLLVSWLALRRAPPWSADTLKRIAGALLVVVGVSLLGPATLKLLR
jgi:uncharacterized membrane protein YfcA